MNKTIPYYDCAIVGGGPAGLSLAAWLGKKGFRVVLYEKSNYPFHKVCGEFLSLESVAHLTDLGVPLTSWGLPRIRTLVLSSPDGTTITRTLTPGGVGLSRYRLDNTLAALARASGAEVLERTKVETADFDGSSFLLESTAGDARAAVCCASFGRRANLDVKWKRDDSRKTMVRFIGVKYHALLDRRPDTIELHYFKDGYCGISPVEEGKHCICYLTTEKKLRDEGNDIGRLEERILSENPLLHKAFSEAVMLYKRPLTVSHIGFATKSVIENHALMLGDAAGMITPMCGNGMSMALESSKLALDPLTRFLEGRVSRKSMEKCYRQLWRSRFSGRMRAGRTIQGLFLRSCAANVLVKALRPFPAAVDLVISQVHGPAAFGGAI